MVNDKIENTTLLRENSEFRMANAFSKHDSFDFMVFEAIAVGVIERETRKMKLLNEYA